MKKSVLKPEMKLGAEPKKVAMLAGLLVVAAIVYFINASDSPSSAPVAPAARPAVNPAVPAPGAAPRPAGPRGTQRASSSNFAKRSAVSAQEFRPTLKPKDPIDPSRIDPTLKLPLLAKVRGVGVSGGHRSLFDFASAPPPKVEIASVKPIVPGAVNTPFIGPIVEKPKPEAPKPPPPPAPPIPLKFYGFTSPIQQPGPKRAFFMEGEDIFVAAEGELIKNRYKVVRIGVNSAVVEDTSNKHQQTLPLEPEQVNS